MIIVADESVDYPIVKRLRAERYEVIAIVELSPSISDDRVLEEANAREAVLLTADKDFGELVYRQKLVHNGVILLRLAGLAALAKAEIVVAMFAHHAEEFPGAFSVISPKLLRIRHVES